MLALLVLVLACAPAWAAAPRYDAQVVNPDLVGGREIPAGAGTVLLVWGSDATILRSENGHDWRHATTPGTADLTQLSSDDKGAVLIAVGAKGEILRSADAGRTWQAAKNPMRDTDLTAVVSAGERAWIAAGTSGRILRSTDDGKSWTLIDSQLKVALRALYFDAASGRMFVGGDEGLVGYSADRGESWQVTVISMPEPATPIGGFHRFGKLLLATSALGRFLTTEDDGAGWDLLQSSSQAFFTDAAWDPDHGVIVVTGHNGDVLRSTDGGRNWEGGEVEIDGRRNFLSAIRHDPRGHALLVTGQSGALARSIDGGQTWAAATRDLRGEIRGLLHDTARGQFIVLGAGGLLARSVDAARWAFAREPLDFPMREVLPAARGDALIVTSKLGDVLRSTDSGASWRTVTPNYPNANTPPDLRNLLVAPARDSMIAGGPPGALLRGSADGSEWKVAVWNDIEAERAFPGMFVDSKRQLIVGVEARGAFMSSSDGGATWKRSDLPLQIEPGHFPFWQGVALESRGVLLAAGEGGRAARSTDGTQWEVIDTGTSENLYGSYADEGSARLLLAGAKGTLLESTDLGKTWRALPTGTDQELRRLHRDARTQSLLCYGAHGTLLRSQDDGRSWRAVATGTEGVLRKLIVEPVSNNLLIAGGQGALLRSRDGGRHWETLATHTTRHFNSLAADPRTGDLVLVGERIVRLVRQ